MVWPGDVGDEALLDVGLEGLVVRAVDLDLCSILGHQHTGERSRAKQGLERAPERTGWHAAVERCIILKSNAMYCK